MKSLILYASPHHGNTKKVAERMAKKIGARLVDVIREEPPEGGCAQWLCPRKGQLSFLSVQGEH